MPVLAFFAQQQANPILGFLPVLLIFAIFYFLLIVPMQRQKKQTKTMLEGLKNGDTVVTSGGLIGTIYALNADDDTLDVRLKPDNVKVRIARSAVSGVVGASTPKS